MAWELVESGRRAPRKKADPLFAEMVEFRRRYVRSDGVTDLEAITLKHPDLTGAFVLYTRGGLSRGELEARILARQTDDEIGALMKIPPGTVAAYEATFFNIRDRLNFPYYILLQAIPNHFDKLINGDAATVLKLCGYFMGPLVLDVMLKHAVDEAGRLRPPQLASLKTEDERLAARAQTAAAAMTGPVDPKRMIELLRVQRVIQHADLLAASGQASRGAEAGAVFDQIVEVSEAEPVTAATVMGENLGTLSGAGHDGTGSHEAA